VVSWWPFGLIILWLLFTNCTLYPCGTKYFDDCSCNSLVVKFTNALHDCCLQENMVVVLAHLHAWVAYCHTSSHHFWALKSCLQCYGTAWSFLAISFLGFIAKCPMLWNLQRRINPCFKVVSNDTLTTRWACMARTTHVLAVVWPQTARAWWHTIVHFQ